MRIVATGNFNVRGEIAKMLRNFYEMMIGKIWREKCIASRRVGRTGIFLSFSTSSVRCKLRKDGCIVIFFLNRSFVAKFIKGPSRKALRAAIESLENRVFLTSVVVNTINDSATPGTISLRTAILTANSSTTPTTITFDPTVFSTAKTITLNGTVLELSNASHATTITGPSSGVTR